jgi:hypothetical protein
MPRLRSFGDCRPGLSQGGEGNSSTHQAYPAGYPTRPAAAVGPGVLRDLQKVLAGEKLSLVLIADGDIADGYHRVSLAYALDPYADVPLKLG